jgi:hypothetical protein
VKRSFNTRDDMSAIQRSVVLAIAVCLLTLLFYNQEARSLEGGLKPEKPQTEKQIDPGDYDFHLGLKVGSLVPVGSHYKEIGLSVATDLLVDVKIGRHFSIGGFFKFFYTEQDYGTFGEEEWGTFGYVAFGGRIRGRIIVNKYFEIRPGLSLGRSVITSKSTWDSWGDHGYIAEKPWGYHLDVSIEASYYIREQLGILFDVGVMYYHVIGMIIMHWPDFDEEEPFEDSFAHLVYISVGVEYSGFW